MGLVRGHSTQELISEGARVSLRVPTARRQPDQVSPRPSQRIRPRACAHSFERFCATAPKPSRRSPEVSTAQSLGQKWCPGVAPDAGERTLGRKRASLDTTRAGRLQRAQLSRATKMAAEVRSCGSRAGGTVDCATTASTAVQRGRYRGARSGRWNITLLTRSTGVPAGALGQLALKRSQRQCRRSRVQATCTAAAVPRAWLRVLDLKLAANERSGIAVDVQQGTIIEDAVW